MALSKTAPPQTQAAYSRNVRGKEYAVEYRPELAGSEIPVGVIHTWTFKVTDLKGRSLSKIDFRVVPAMTQHAHGMTTDLKTTKTGPGSYRVEGMKFHMPGWWTIGIEISRGDQEEELAFQLLIQSKADAGAAPETDLDILKPLWVGSLPPLPQDPKAASLGKKLFSDASLSKDGKVSCQGCHSPDHAFSGNRTTLVEGHGIRKIPSLVGVGWQNWFFWDGRKDSLWSQALGPIENPAEHALTREEWNRKVLAKYGAEYAALYGSPKKRPLSKNLNDQIFVNTGKAIAAYERTLAPTPAPFDRYIEALMAKKDASSVSGFGACERAGLHVFLTNGRCINCHNGPRFENNSFHNTGVPMQKEDLTRTRFNGLEDALKDPFNCHSRFARDGKKRPDCSELERAPRFSSILGGAFKTPTLRNVALTAPYMHGGQFKTLEEVIQHYKLAPDPIIGGTELLPVTLSDEESKSLVCFLKSLTSEASPGK